MEQYYVKHHVNNGYVIVDQDENQITGVMSYDDANRVVKQWNNPFIQYCNRNHISIRCYNAMMRYGIDENTDLTDLSPYRTLGRKSGEELRNLQIGYKQNR